MRTRGALLQRTVRHQSTKTRRDASLNELCVIIVSLSRCTVLYRRRNDHEEKMYQEKKKREEKAAKAMAYRAQEDNFSTALSKGGTEAEAALEEFKKLRKLGVDSEAEARAFQRLGHMPSPATSVSAASSSAAHTSPYEHTSKHVLQLRPQRKEMQVVELHQLPSPQGM